MSITKQVIKNNVLEWNPNNHRTLNEVLRERTLSFGCVLETDFNSHANTVYRSKRTSKRYRTALTDRYGCKHKCMHETHCTQHKVQSVRRKQPDKLILYCRKCEYMSYDLSKKICHCCNVQFSFRARTGTSTHTEKPRY